MSHNDSPLHTHPSHSHAPFFLCNIHLFADVRNSVWYGVMCIYFGMCFVVGHGISRALSWPEGWLVHEQLCLHGGRRSSNGQPLQR